MTPQQHQALAARVRTDLDLIERSPVFGKLSGTIRRQVSEDLEKQFDGLGYSNLIYPHSLEKLGLREDQKMEQRKEILRFEPSHFDPSNEEQRLVDMLQEGADCSLSHEWQWRVGEHCRFMNDKGWYPFFVTLTVDPLYHDPEEVFGLGATALRDYLKKLARVAMKECGLTRSEMHKASDRDYLHHFFSVEHGKSGHHHHAHGILWFREIPSSWKLDPNFGTPNAVNRRCKPLESYWTYCVPEQRPANYYWFVGCPWQKLGHRVPLDDKGKGLTLLAPEMGGFYCAKYMGKEDKAWKHRVKATRYLGLTNLLEAIKSAPMKVLEQQVTILPTFDHQIIQNTSLSVPTRLIRRLSRLELYCREYMSTDLQTLLSPKPKPFCAMVDSLKHTRPWLLASEDRYNWLLSVLPPAPKEFCEEDWFDSLIYFRERGFSAFSTETVDAIGGYKA